MPNLRQIISLKEKYSACDSKLRNVKKFLDEGRIFKKSFNLNNLNEHFDLDLSIPDLISYFESGTKEDVVLLFIDITNFSSLTERKSSYFLTSYLNNYYKRAFPIIYKYGGQIEKLMGDGIICLFGKPFLNVVWPKEFNNAERCATELISTFKGTNKEVKIALHSGEITYYKTPGTLYEEYTMIGKPLTELFRLESVSANNSLNYFADSIYDHLNPRSSLQISTYKNLFLTLYSMDVALKGVDYTKIKYLRMSN